MLPGIHKSHTLLDTTPNYPALVLRSFLLCSEKHSIVLDDGTSCVEARGRKQGDVHFASHNVKKPKN